MCILALLKIFEVPRVVLLRIPFVQDETMDCWCSVSWCFEGL